MTTSLVTTITEEQLIELDCCDEYSLRHMHGEVGLLIDSYRVLQAENAVMKEFLEPQKPGTVQKRLRWLQNIADAKKYGLPGWLMKSLDNTAKEIQNSIKYGGTGRLQDRITDLEASNKVLLDALDEIGGLSRALRVGGPDPMDLQDLSDALNQAVDLAHTAIEKARGGS